MKIKHIVLAAILSIGAYALTPAEIDAQNKRSIQIAPGSTMTSSTYKDASGSEDINDWTPKDYEKNLGKDLADGIKNAAMLFETIQGRDKAMGKNPNEMSSEALKELEQVKYWDKTSQDGLIAGSTSGSTFNNATGTVKCYITRDIPIRYTCEKTGFTVSKEMSSDGVVAKKLCDENCNVQMPCQVLNSGYTDKTDVIADASLSGEAGLVYTVSKALDTALKVKNLGLKIEIDKKEGKKVEEGDIRGSITVTITDLGEEIDIIKDYPFRKGDEIGNINISRYASNIKITIKRNTEDLQLTIKDVEISYMSYAKYACADLQDMSWIPANQFGSKCPSGKLTTFNVGAKSIQICADGPIIGDNRDGTYSELGACQAVCKKTFECKMDTRVSDTNLLQDYREGCIQGQSGCETDSVCENLRLKGTKILNENVFNARQKVKNTIINSNQVQGVERPRLLLKNDVEFQTRLAEEWKDEAYQYMLTNSTYGVSKAKIGDDTEMNSAYSFGVNSVSADGIPIRSLYWQLKPKALDVGESVYYYGIIEAVVEKYKDTSYGTKIKSRDKIFYVKTDLNNDYYKPFARIVDYSQRLEDASGTSETTNSLATWGYQTFNGSNWIMQNKSSVAEYMNNAVLAVDKPFIRIPIIQDIKNFNMALPGIVRSTVKVGPYITPFYSGSFTGSGETIGKYTQYATYSKTRLTYEQIFTMIQDAKLLPIYDNITPRIYSKAIGGDNFTTSGNIDFYLYGKNDKKDGYVRMFPKQDELNKKGYVFIFAY